MVHYSSGGLASSVAFSDTEVLCIHIVDNRTLRMAFHNTDLLRPGGKRPLSVKSY